MTYTRSDLKQRINAGIKGKIGILINQNETADMAVREITSLVDLRSAKRRSLLTPKLFSDVFQYASPVDLKDEAIIGLEPQSQSTRVPQLTLVPPDDFRRNKRTDTIAVEDHDQIKKILINLQISDTKSVVSNLDSLTSGGGTWTAFGDATNLHINSSDFVEGTGSLAFDISGAGGTTAGIVNENLLSFSIEEFIKGNSSLFTFHKITDPANITSYTLRMGTDSSNYYEKTITSTSENVEFFSGVQLLRFDMVNLTEVGLVDDTNIQYCAIFMNKDASKINETNYWFDHIILRRGENVNLHYYSEYPWRDVNGVYKKKSTSDSDILNVSETEFQLMVKKGIEIAGEEVDEFDASDRAKNWLKENIPEYEKRNSSEAMSQITEYAEFI